MLITNKLLTEWEACADDKAKFNEIFPEGKTAPEAIQGLIDADCKSYAFWLFNKIKKENLLPEYTAKGLCNSGDCNSGNWNSGDWNSGNWNSGDRNSGDRNSGDRNSGNWNSGDWNSGFFNSTEPETIRVFNKNIPKNVWIDAYKPDFLYFPLTEFVSVHSMTKEEKEKHPNNATTGGFLRVLSYKEAFKRSWDEADPVDREIVRDLPGFDADVFFEISGIDLRKQKENGR